MYAWKRVYVEIDQMYKVGATIIREHIGDSDNLNNDWLYVDNTNPFL